MENGKWKAEKKVEELKMFRSLRSCVRIFAFGKNQTPFKGIFFLRCDAVGVARTDAFF